MSIITKIRGNAGEIFVAHHLEQQGFQIIKRNYRKPYGEIDIIAHCCGLLIFVEVKTRLRHTVDPAEIIVPSKQRKIIMVAKMFLAEHTYHNTIYQFDVAFIEEKNGLYQMDYISNAFTDEG
jgi:putative endonuclease